MGMNMLVNDVMRIRKNLEDLMEDEMTSFSESEQVYLVRIHTLMDELVLEMMHRVD